MAYEIGTKVFGDWEIIREIGHGAYGRVYEVRKTEYGVTARSAMKVVRIPASDKEIQEARFDGMNDESIIHYFRGFVEDLVNEIAVMTRLSGHPNIVAYQDHHIVEYTDRIGWDILTRMELLESLVNYQFRVKALREKEIVQLGIDIAKALMVCEKNSIVHRDVKPDNIFRDASGNFKLGDFGVARTVEKTMGGLSKKGTETYMAPEVYFGKSYGKTVDIYSLGLVLYRLTNRNSLPFYPLSANNLGYQEREAAINKRMQGAPIPAPRDASPLLSLVILKACQADPKLRFQSAEELKKALEEVAQVKETRQKYSFNQAEQEKGTSTLQEEETKGIYEEDNEETVGAYTGDSIKRENEREVSSGSGDENEAVSVKGIQYDFTPPSSKKKERPAIIAGILALGIVAALIIFILWPMTRTVTVDGGNGSGSYKPGDIVTITADKKAGYVFTGWKSIDGDVSLEDGSAYETTFVMGKENVHLAASYEEQKHHLTVIGGEGSGDYRFGETVTITADPAQEGFVFSRWYTEESYFLVADNETVSFDMPDRDIVIAACYNKEKKTN